MGQEQEQTERAHPGIDSFRESIQTAVAVNSTAFGFSIMVTAILAAIAQEHGAPTAIEILLFAGGGVLAFTVLDLLASEGFQRSMNREPPEVITHAASMSFASVGLSIGAAIGVANLVKGSVVWPVTSLIAATVFVVVVGIELTIAERAREEGQIECEDDDEGASADREPGEQ